MDVYGPLFRSVLLPTWETRVHRRSTLALAADLRRSQWSSLADLTTAQERALARLLGHAYANVPFYRERFERAGIRDPRRDLAGIVDLVKLPVVTQREIRTAEAAKSRRSTAGPEPAITKSTSGTTGEPFVFGYERSSEEWRQAVKIRGYEWAGYRPGDRVVHFWGTAAPVGKKALVDRWLRREVYVPCAVLGDAELRAAVRTIEQVRPTAIVCYTQAGAELARFVTRHGLRTWGEIAVICGAERLYPHQREDLVRAFGPNVFETYGCREVMLIGSECAAHDGLHVSMENLVVEVVVTEPDGGTRHARPGETGEVVITDLHNYAMPFIRYANGDLAVAADPSERCPCGRALPRLRSIEGRSNDVLRDGEGRAVSGVAFGFLFVELERAVRKFQLVQHRDGAVTLRVAVEAPLSPAAVAKLRDGCARLLRGVPVTVEVVDDIPTTKTGKRRLVIREES